MTIETKYEIGQRVLIEQLKISGVIQAIYYLNQVEYRVRYFDSGNIQDPYFFENELLSIGDNES